ncbi:hypothetical protein D1AOALGA4SA_12193 [Olavius algarvensis Delta 1 endosymbiont]|nr:hypothetical protein D1AOALGA4SA_12193 [Olavius algarvensis Delta 1 endosymbiont]
MPAPLKYRYNGSALLVLGRTLEWTHKRKNSHYISMIR